MVYLPNLEPSSALLEDLVLDVAEAILFSLIFPIFLPPSFQTDKYNQICSILKRTSLKFPAIQAVTPSIFPPLWPYLSQEVLNLLLPLPAFLLTEGSEGTYLQQRAQDRGQNMKWYLSISVSFDIAGNRGKHISWQLMTDFLAPFPDKREPRHHLVLGYRCKA